MNKQPPKKYSIQIANGLHAMQTDREYLVWHPVKHDRTAWGMWHLHSEGRFRDKYAERLTRLAHLEYTLPPSQDWS